MRILIRRGRDHEQFRRYLLKGVAAKPAGPMDSAYFERLRKQAKD